ncbi:MAG: nickel-dependent hydrogenase large subunit [Anaerolineae bacterium]|nr:nickel-dependent hydrogenase large subunit [Anaerolineae bacterium]
MSRITIPIGPQHPLLKEPLAFQLTVEGEQVIDSAMRIGYVHRGIERLSQTRTYIQNIYLMERVCGICSHVHTTTYCQAVESLLGLQVPARGLFLRALLCEMERIHSHLLWLGVLAKNMGLDTIFMYAWRDREIVLDMMEDLSGGRVAHAVNIIGGVRIDVDEDTFQMLCRRCDVLEIQAHKLLDVVTHDRSLKGRTEGIGILTPQQVRDFCVVGPVARASGADMDLRRDAPLSPYDIIPVHVVTHNAGDVWARTYVRMLETVESLRICREILRLLPDGPVSIRSPRRVPAGEVVSRTEAPRGEVIYYIRSDGSQYPARVKIRTPTLTALATLKQQLRNVNMADVSVVLSGVDLCIACADR